VATTALTVVAVVTDDSVTWKPGRLNNTDAAEGDDGRAALVESITLAGEPKLRGGSRGGCGASRVDAAGSGCD